MIVFFYQLDEQFLYFNAFITFIYIFQHYCAHLQEDNCINTTSGIVTLETTEWSKLDNSLVSKVTITYAVLIQLSS